MSAIALPGLSRSLRVTGDAGSLLVQAVAEDPAALTPEESPQSVIGIDPFQGVVLAPFIDTEHVLHLVTGAAPDRAGGRTGQIATAQTGHYRVERGKGTQNWSIWPPCSASNQADHPRPDSAIGLYGRVRRANGV